MTGKVYIFAASKPILKHFSIIFIKRMKKTTIELHLMRI